MKNTFIALFSLILLAVSSVVFASECPLCDAAELLSAGFGGWLFGLFSSKNSNVNNTQTVDQLALNGSLLISAASKGQLLEVKRLLKKGAVVNLQDANEWTALMYAAHAGYSDVVKELLEKGANPNITSSRGQNAFDYAKTPEICEILKKYSTW